MSIRSIRFTVLVLRTGTSGPALTVSNKRAVEVEQGLCSIHTKISERSKRDSNPLLPIRRVFHD